MIHFSTRFLSFVEIRTKLISVACFVTAMAYVYFSHRNIHMLSSIIFFVSMILFDMTTTAINNFLDAKRAKIPTHYSNQVSIFIILLMLQISMCLGIFLAIQHGIIVLLLGLLCFISGILYSFGPIPISSTPFGEIVSGVVQGFVLPFILLYINMDKEAIATIQISMPNVFISFNLIATIKAVLVFSPLIFGIANIMMANNLCDLSEDIKVKRHTLPYYIGKDNALVLFGALYDIAFVCITIGGILRIVPVICIFSIFCRIIIRKNVLSFRAVQDKGTTFALSIQNFILLIFPYSLLICLGAFLK